MQVFLSEKNVINMICYGMHAMSCSNISRYPGTLIHIIQGKGQERYGPLKTKSSYKYYYNKNKNNKIILIIIKINKNKNF